MTSVRRWFVVLRKKNQRITCWSHIVVLEPWPVSYFPISPFLYLIISCSFSLSCYIKALKNSIQILAWNCNTPSCFFLNLILVFIKLLMHFIPNTLLIFSCPCGSSEVPPIWAQYAGSWSFKLFNSTCKCHGSCMSPVSYTVKEMFLSSVRAQGPEGAPF